ncbi:MAG: DNA-deoxyinosine glycosylase [Clostridiales bacterium]|jgi:hypoxanthine-DNA glycosylase|nr:DNA-deoxyinosine glycosylase [Clostridiales bacterium]
MNKRVVHPVSPVFNEESKILVLGTFPSVKSREGEFFYHHPQNRFWRVISSICNEKLPETIDDKKQLLLRNRIALWDVVQSCEIIGSADSSIKNVIANDIRPILKQADILRIYANGGRAYQLYNRYIYKNIKREIILLPSTSPANASYSLEKLIDIWSVIKSVKE